VDLVVSIHTVWIRAESLQHSFDAEGRAGDLDLLADRILVSEKRLGGGEADEPTYSSRSVVPMTSEVRFANGELTSMPPVERIGLTSMISSISSPSAATSSSDSWPSFWMPPCMAALLLTIQILPALKRRSILASMSCCAPEPTA
jgi:hypothetical protein